MKNELDMLKCTKTVLSSEILDRPSVFQFPPPGGVLRTILLFKVERLSESCTDLKQANAPFRVREPRQGRKNWVSAHQRALFQKNCPISKFWPTSNFFYIDRLEDLTPPNWSYDLFLGQGTFSMNSVVWGQRNSRLNGAMRPNNLLTQKMRFPLHTYYSSR